MDYALRKKIVMRVVLGALLVVVIGIAFVIDSPAPSSAPGPASATSVQSPHPQLFSQDASQSIKDRIATLKHAVEKDTTTATHALALAQMLQDAHNSEEALQYFEAGLKLEPQNHMARVDYSLCLYETGRSDEALQQNLHVLKEDPNFVPALFNVGALYANKGMRDSAATYWRKLIAVSPHDTLAARAKENLKILDAAPL